MYALLDEDIQKYAERQGRSNKDALNLFFEAVTLSRKFFANEPDYYRTLLFAICNEGGREYRSMFRGPLRAPWRALVEDARNSGYLSPELDADAFADNLALIFFAAILEWVSGEAS